MTLEFCSMSSQVISYDDLSYHMMNDIDYTNEYYMNQNMVKRYVESRGLSFHPKHYIYDYYKIEVYGRTIHMLKEFPDEEVLIVNRLHPHRYHT